MNFLKHIRLALYLIVPLYTTGSLMAQAAVKPEGITTVAGQRTNPAQKPLVIGVDIFSPPFVMKGGKGELYGYDINMMSSVCQIMHRTCTYQVIKWIDLLPAVLNNQVDLAVSSITITPERAKLISFSLPYSLSFSRFITNNNTVTPTPFLLSSLDGKKIGVYKGTVYEDQATHIGVKNPIVITYTGYDDALKGLSDKEVDYILLDNPTALYWAANSSGAFKEVGKPYEYGFGFGVAVSKTNQDLIPELNKAILQYQNTDEYHQNYHRYLQEF
jgi:polar amino acid transport system substrate-binding protein